MKVLVYGWYNQLNIGDDLFVSAFKKLFPTYEFRFKDNIRVADLQDIDAVFFGGGSFLLELPNIDPGALEKLKKLPLFYLGVGVEADIHPVHMDLISLAKIVATRSADQLDRLKVLNPNTIWVPDLVYCLQEDVEKAEKLPRSILVMPNINVVPNHLDPYWRHASWAHFKSEFSQFLDVLREDNYKIDFLSMCRGKRDNDDWAAGEIISHMVHRNKFLLDEQPMGIQPVSRLISRYNLIITQRFHGIVLAEMTKTPYIAIHHHDKLKNSKPNHGSFVSYYGINKQALFDSFNHTIKMNFDQTLPIEPNIFEAFSQKITELVENGSICRNQT
jgi:polysaccharide pyruvyl transferase WcaK-like protein